MDYLQYIKEQQLLPEDSLEFLQLQSYLQRFQNGQYGEGHALFTAMAAFPVFLTPELLYKLWLNFQAYRDEAGDKRKIHRIEVSDLLLSGLLREVAVDIYEMQPAIRTALLSCLEKRFREKRNILRELAEFMLYYVRSYQLEGESVTTAVREAQEWNALAYVDPAAAVRQIREALSGSIAAGSPTRQLRINLLLQRLDEQYGRTNTTTGQLDAFRTLVDYSQGMSEFIQGNHRKALQRFRNLEQRAPLSSTGGTNLKQVKMPIPKAIYEGLQQPSSETESLEQSQVFALFVGIDRYTGLPPLKGSIQEANEMAYLISQLIPKERLQSNTVLDAAAHKKLILGNWQDYLQQAREDDVVLFYFAGHGENLRQNALLLTDYHREKNPEETITAEEFQQLIKDYATNNPFIVLILDTATSGENWLPPQNEQYLVLTAGKSETIAFEAQEAGAFSQLLREKLSAKNGAVTYQQLIGEVREVILSKSPRLPEIFGAESAALRLFLHNAYSPAPRIQELLREAGYYEGPIGEEHRSAAEEALRRFTEDWQVEAGPMKAVQQKILSDQREELRVLTVGGQVSEPVDAALAELLENLSFPIRPEIYQPPDPQALAAQKHQPLESEVAEAAARRIDEADFIILLLDDALLQNETSRAVAERIRQWRQTRFLPVVPLLIQDCDWQRHPVAQLPEMALYRKKGNFLELEWITGSGMNMIREELEGIGRFRPAAQEPNVHLIQVLMESLAPYVKEIAYLADREQSGEQISILDKRRIILTSLPFPLSEHLRKLFVPVEPGVVGYDRVGKNRLQQLVVTYHTTFQLITATLLAAFRQVYPVADDPESGEKIFEAFSSFFLEENSDQPFIKKNYALLIQPVCRFLDGQSEPFPLVKYLTTVFSDPGEEFSQALVSLEKLSGLAFDDNLSDREIAGFCTRAEESLSFVLKKLSFLALPGLTSIKKVEVHQYPGLLEPIFSHHLVNMETTFVGLSESYSTYNYYLDSYSVLWLDEKNQHFLNLSPFLIDENAFNEQAELAKLFFLGYYNPERKSYFYYYAYKPFEPPLEVTEERFPVIWHQLQEFQTHRFIDPFSRDAEEQQSLGNSLLGFGTTDSVENQSGTGGLGGGFEPNELLTSAMIEALEPYSDELAANLERERVGEQISQARLRTIALNSLPAPLAVHLRKLLSSDDESRIGRPRLLKLLHTFRVLSDLVLSSQLSVLREKIVLEQISNLPATTIEHIRRYCYDSKDESGDLIQSLQRTLHPSETEIGPVENVAMVYNRLATIERTVRAKQPLDEQKIAPLCFEAEQLLASLLKGSSPLYRYPLTSVKSIEVHHYPGSPLSFVHRIVHQEMTLLGLEETKISRKSTLDSHSVLWLDEESFRYLNFSPFIIDAATFNKEQGISNLYFLDRHDAEGETYFYYSSWNPDEPPLLVNKERFPVVWRQLQYFQQLLGDLESREPASGDLRKLLFDLGFASQLEAARKIDISPQVIPLIIPVPPAAGPGLLRDRICNEFALPPESVVRLHADEINTYGFSERAFLQAIIDELRLDCEPELEDFAGQMTDSFSKSELVIALESFSPVNTSALPLIYLAFANDSSSPLLTLVQEERELRELLRPLEVTGDINVRHDSFATAAQIADTLQQYRQDLTILHLAGHADQSTLLVETGEAQAAGLAALLGQCPNLKLVVLNGSATRNQVEALLKNGVPAVIANNAPVDDASAKNFASVFYRALANRHNLSEAFETGIASVETMTGNLNVRRGFKMEKEEDENTPLWGLFTKDQEQSLDYRLPINKNRAFALELLDFSDRLARALREQRSAGGLRNCWIMLSVDELPADVPPKESYNWYVDPAVLPRVERVPREELEEWTKQLLQEDRERVRGKFLPAYEPMYPLEAIRALCRELDVEDLYRSYFQEYEIQETSIQEEKIQQKPAYGSFIDPRDGQTYRTIDINGQTWMVDNLNYDVGEECWFYNDDPQNAGPYGRLYTWEAAQRACPEGWRLPGIEEIRNLLKQFNNNKEAFEALTAGGETGLNFSFGGSRMTNGAYSHLNEVGFYWTGSTYEEAQKWYFSFNRRIHNAFTSFTENANGFHCRLIKLEEENQL